MAAKNKKTAYNGKPFLVAMIVLAVVSVLNMIFVFNTYRDTTTTFTTTSDEMHHVNTANGHLNAANSAVLRIVGNVGSGDSQEEKLASLKANMAEIHEHFQVIDYEIEEYMKTEGHDENAQRRFEHAKIYVDAYHNRMLSYQEKLNGLTAFLDRNSEEYMDRTSPEFNKKEFDEKYDELQKFEDDIPNVYEQEIQPLQNAAQQMMVASIAIGSAAAGKRTAKTVLYLYYALGVMAVILIAGEITLFLISRYTRRATEEIERKNAQFAEASSKLMRSREKMEDIALTNILTGLKNRYALDQDLTERLANEQFNIAVFDMDNFRSINDMYGYDFGDEYLALVAERLINEFGQHAEIYNISGNEFCAVFNREVSDSQALHYVEGIATVISSPYTVFNLTVQLPVSASTYHYVAGDCLNVNSLLVKLDNALRNAKRQGGGQIHQVMNL